MKSLEELEKVYAEELKRKDKLIDDLRQQNKVLMKTALKQSEKNIELQQKIEKVMKG